MHSGTHKNSKPHILLTTILLSKVVVYPDTHAYTNTNERMPSYQSSDRRAPCRPWPVHVCDGSCDDSNSSDPAARRYF